MTWVVWRDPDGRIGVTHHPDSVRAVNACRTQGKLPLSIAGTRDEAEKIAGDMLARLAP